MCTKGKKRRGENRLDYSEAQCTLPTIPKVSTFCHFVY